MRGAIPIALAGTASALQIPLRLPQLPKKLSWSSGAAHVDVDSLPQIESKALQDTIEIANLQKRAERLYDVAKLSEPEYNHPTRVIGSRGHLGTLEYIKSVLATLGDYYNVTEQVFPAVTGTVREARLVIGTDVPSATAFSLSPPTKNKQPVYGDLILVHGSGCKSSDYPQNATNNIVIVLRGECSFGAKSELAGRAGAVAAVVVNNEEGDLHGTLGEPNEHHVATFGLSKELGDKYLDQLKEGKSLDSIAYMDSDVNTIMTTNIIAQTTHGDPNNCVAVGGHSDGVEEGPGINDDGSGSLSVLEIAVQLSSFRVNNCVRLAWWAGEEEGLLGSNYYVQSLSEEENKKIRLFGDYDMMASPNFAYQVYNATDDENPAGSQLLRDLYIDWYTEQGLNHTLIPFDGRSDYDGFIRAGIPAGGIATGAEGIKTAEEEAMFGGKKGEWYDPNYHQIGDDLTNLNHTAWEVNTRLIAHSVGTFAASFEGFPERTTEPRATKAKPTKYRGHKLIM
ncbi:Aminopeptidase Y [Purpureocillium takamizusanense]|uniref:Peptide hydrolase n=1 Tax=Purpureocillium takamizusanense TaxID=2060973 RepID=A0A9Q8Q7L5_9HYPO|nr:Aminopeptidase Y [Purpureocillium takamizusanense]UNI13951.1 Aminopeptidase Y [Purpureocillium takamizusanense]